MIVKGWRIRKDCRLCGAGKLETVLELEPTPPANEFVKEEDPPQELIPLYLARCPSCGHVQLPVVVDPERLFRNYVYVSGTSPSFVEHFRKYAADCVGTYDVRASDLVVDVGSNDGTLLKEFKALGMSVVGVDPAAAIAQQAIVDGVPTYVEFFDRKLAQTIQWNTGRRAALVTANNVFAHADDLKSIALGARDLLEYGRGRFVFEVQYLVDLVEKNLFDMVYHEHLSYHSLGPLVPFFDSVGMTLVDAQHVDTHGGSIRCAASPNRGDHQTDRLRALLRAEADRLALAVDPFGKMKRRIDDAGERLRGFLSGAKLEGRVVVGYGAPAKLTTLSHQFGVARSDVAYIVDDSPWKQGLLAPGTRIPVLAPQAMFNSVDPADAVVVFAWNFAEQIERKLRAGGFRGSIVVPLPAFRETQQDLHVTVPLNQEI